MTVINSAPNANRRLLTTALALAVLFGFGFWICYHYAWQFTFVQPIDGGLIMGPAWRIANGQVPFLDFSTIQGLSAALSEAPFLAIFGPTIRGAVIHISVINGFAGILAYLILRHAHLAQLPAFIFAMLTTVIFYPPQGMAFAVQHGAFGMLIALLGAFYGESDAPNRQKQRTAWFIAGLGLAFAFFGKQTLGFMAPGIILLLFAGSRIDRLGKTAFLVLGGLTPFLLLFLAAGADNAAFSRMLNFMVLMPWQFGGGRLDADINEALLVYELAPSPSIVLAFGGAVIGIFISRALKPADDSAAANNKRRRARLHIIIGAAIMAGNVSLSHIHGWNPHILLQLIFVAAGLVAAGLAQLLRSSTPADGTPAENAMPRVIGRAFVILFVFVAAFDTWWMHINLNKHRGIRNQQAVFGARLKIPDTALYPAIRGVKFREMKIREPVPRTVNRAAVLANIELNRRQIAFLRTLPYEVIVTGISKHVQIFAGKVPTIPVVSIQPGASSPFRDSKAYEMLISDLERNIKIFNVGGIAVSNVQLPSVATKFSSHPDIFCGVRKSADVYLAELCPRDKLPKGFGETIAQIIGLDGPLYH